MKPSVLILFSCLIGGLAVAEESKPAAPRRVSLADAAREEAGKLKAGCIATAERTPDGNVRFSLEGKDKPEGATPESLLFEIGSVSKTFTGVLLAQAVVEGKARLDMTVAEVLGKDASFEDLDVGNITLVQLSTHTSGLPRLAPNMILGVKPEDPYAGYDEAMMLAALKSLKMEPAPQRASYSNFGVGLLGVLLGRLYQQPWETLVRDKVFVPLGMKDSQADAAVSALPLAQPHAGGKPVLAWSFKAIGAAGAIRSTVADMMRYGQAVANPVASPLKQALELALKPHASWPSSGGKIGLGFIVEEENGVVRYSHGGATAGSRAALEVEPVSGAIRVVLASNSVVPVEGLVAKAAGRETDAAISRDIVAVPDEILRAYVGIYMVDNDTKFTVLHQRGTLWIRLTSQAFYPYYPSAEDTFFAKVTPVQIRFIKQEGKVRLLELLQGGRRILASRTEEAAPNITFRSKEELAPYAGDYALLGLTNLRVTVGDSSLMVRLQGQPSMPVFETAVDTFEYDGVEAKITFSRDGEGQVNGLVLEQNGAKVPAGKKKTPAADKK